MPVSGSRRVKKAFLFFRKLTQSTTMRSENRTSKVSLQRIIQLRIKKIINYSKQPRTKITRNFSVPQDWYNSIILEGNPNTDSCLSFSFEEGSWFFFLFFFTFSLLRRKAIPISLLLLSWAALLTHTLFIPEFLRILESSCFCVTILWQESNVWLIISEHLCQQHYLYAIKSQSFR